MLPVTSSRFIFRTLLLLCLTVALIFELQQGIKTGRELQNNEHILYKANSIDSLFDVLIKSVNWILPVDGDHENNSDNNLDQNYDLYNFQNPVVVANTNDVVIQLPNPKVGQHRPDKDTVFCFARGYSIEVLARFIRSLLQTGYSGDIVIGVLPWEEQQEKNQEIHEFLTYHAEHHNVVVYEINLDCQTPRNLQCQVLHFYLNKTTSEYLQDYREHRPISQLRYEYYWVWSQYYNYKSRILLADARDLYFQRNPFDFLPNQRGVDTTLYVIGENPDLRLDQESINMNWIRRASGGKSKLKTIIDSLRNKTILCSGTTLGGKIAIESYVRRMIQAYDETHCNLGGCDQGYHNILVYTDLLLQRPNNETTTSLAHGGFRKDLSKTSLLSQPQRIEKIECSTFGFSFVTTLAMYCIYHKPLRAFGLLDNTTDMVLNWDGSVSAIVHQFDRCPELNAIMEKRGKLLLEAWRKDNDRISQFPQSNK